MSRTRRDLSYYEQLTVQISPKKSEDFLTGIEHRLRTSLPNFGTVLELQMLRTNDKEVIPGRPNTAIVVFASQVAVTRALASSRRHKSGSLWHTNSILARPLDTTGPVAERFSKQIVPKLNSSSKSNDPGLLSEPQSPLQRPSQPTSSTSTGSVPPLGASRPITEGWVVASSTAATSSRTPCLKSSHTPGSLEWMRARIAQLETELDSANAVRDMAISEQHVIRQAYQVERDARRIAMAQKSAAEAELSRKEVERSQLRAELEVALARESALLEGNNALRGLLVLAEGELKLVRSALEESEKYGVRLKALEAELEEVQDREHKLQLEKSRYEQEKTNPIELANAKEKLEATNSEVKRLKGDLALAQEQLGATQTSLGLMGQKYSSAHRMYESAKEKLGVYKERLENEEKVVHKLKNTLTPEVYRSLGATYGALGEYLSVIGLPPVSVTGNFGAKKELD